MVLTILEAEVSPKRWNDLKKAYENLVKNAPAGPAPIQSWLLQDRADVNIWRLMGLWNSHEDVENMRQRGTPRGILMFRDLGSEPAMSMFDVIATTAVPEATPMSPH